MVSRDRFAALFHQAPVGYVVLDDNGMIVDANDTFRSMIGCDGEPLRGRALVGFLQPTDQPRFQARFKAFFKKPAAKSLEAALRVKGGHARVVRMAASKPTEGFRAAGDGASGLLLTISDVTELKQMEAEKQAAERQAERLRKFESLGRMAAAVAHNFNNLLAVIMGNVELAMEDQGRTPETAAYLRHAMRASQRAAALSGSMVTYLGLNRDRYQPVDLVAMVRASLPDLRAEMPDTIAWRAVLPDAATMIRGNGAQIRQVLNELLANAREAMAQRRGTVRLGVHTAGREQIPASHRFPADWTPEANTYARIAVEDTGDGIADEDLDRIFDPFYSSKFTGRGMGLSVVLGIVKAHGGGLTVASTPGKGTIVHVYLPLFQGSPGSG
nr:ATP-binding protein [Desulfatitalea alkaliphila]